MSSNFKIVQEWCPALPLVDQPRESPVFLMNGNEWFFRFELHIVTNEVSDYVLYIKLKNKRKNGKSCDVSFKVKYTHLNFNLHEGNFEVSDISSYIWYRPKPPPFSHLYEKKFTFIFWFHEPFPQLGNETGDLTDVTAACNASEETQKSTKSSKNLHLEALSRDFSKLLDESSTFDVDITCEGKTFKAHRIVLETRSTVFEAMLRSDMVEGKTGTIKLEDITASIFEIFLRYLYSGTHPDLSIDAAKQYYVASDKYAVEELKATCSEFLIKNLSEGNACEVLVLADQHSDESFRNDVIAYIVEKKIPQRDKQWPHFCKKYPNLAIEMQNLYIQKHCSQ